MSNFCKVYEAGYPHFAWVTKIAENLWEVKATKSDKIARAHEKNQACELVWGYETYRSYRIDRQSFNQLS